MKLDYWLPRITMIGAGRAGWLVNKSVKQELYKLLQTEETHSFMTIFQASRKKVYMLFNLEPDITVTGGAWYSDQDFESEFVEVLNQQCYKYLEQKV